MTVTFPLSHETLIGKLAYSLTRAGYFLATAESCTGGLIAAACTDVPGSSAWFRGGIVAYANEVKEDVLGVPAGLIRDHGAVSGPVAKKMALGALRACKAQVAVSTTGIAGPGGGSAEKPVGTVWVALAVRERKGVCEFDHEALCRRLPGCSRVGPDEDGILVNAMRHHFGGPRDAVRANAAERALLDLTVLLEENVVR